MEIQIESHPSTTDYFFYTILLHEYALKPSLIDLQIASHSVGYI